MTTSKMIRWPQKDLEAVEAAAKEAGLSFSVFVRRAALAALDHEAVKEVPVVAPSPRRPVERRSAPRKGPRKGMCEHRIPTDSYCPRCDG